ncbi:competence protein ComJ [Cupriavidus sp. 2MCAB6]|uniref:competence protein ComJ n=1 Tax=Cupriavidus sp. 2MCAB6 TaxID=3232981 RepID=UPI003F8DF338
MQQFTFDVFADYHQFYVQDRGINPEAPTDWTDEDVERRAKVADNVVVICPLRNMTVPVTLELHEAEPAID